MRGGQVADEDVAPPGVDVDGLGELQPVPDGHDRHLNQGEEQAEDDLEEKAGDEMRMNLSIFLRVYEPAIWDRRIWPFRPDPAARV